MRIPDRVKIGGVDVGVIKEPSIDEDERYLGLADCVGNKIYLATHNKGRRVCPHQAAIVFLHEIIHHVSDQGGVGLKERQVQAVAAGLYQVLKDNKLRF